VVRGRTGKSTCCALYRFSRLCRRGSRATSTPAANIGRIWSERRWTYALADAALLVADADRVTLEDRYTGNQDGHEIDIGRLTI
jgi:hypothetical protein